MGKNEITLEYVRNKLGKKAENMTDEDVKKYLEFLRYITNKAIDSALKIT